MKINNIIFDFGGVLLDWNPHYIYDPYFGDAEKAEWFLTHICTFEWNQQHDGGRPIAEGVAELTAQYPEWAKEIALYYDQFLTAISGQIPGMEELIKQLKASGLHTYGLTNWSAETFALVRPKYPVLDLMEDIIVSGEEKVMKPDPEIFRRALLRFRIQPSDTLFIDDNPANTAAAEALGIHTLTFQNPETLANDLRRDGILA